MTLARRYDWSGTPLKAGQGPAAAHLRGSAMPPTPIFNKIVIFDIFISILGPGTYFIMILDPVAPFSKNTSPQRAMATHFGSEMGRR